VQILGYGINASSGALKVLTISPYAAGAGPIAIWRLVERLSNAARIGVTRFDCHASMTNVAHRASPQIGRNFSLNMRLVFFPITGYHR
jgi:hypothetical protein